MVGTNKAEATAEIWWMGIMPAFHRRGIGRKLFDAARRRAARVGCATMAVNEDDPRNPLAWMTLPVR